ncbi:MAG TPA: FAD-dependent oxidoreductase [Thermoanaerobaculia bacterium]|jgi:glycine/D-amino acid oxidase-like deaminating enzyme|nr:FAD-dependent oxidoreductase [Thermoanaerobaculia bacterium]
MPRPAHPSRYRYELPFRARHRRIRNLPSADRDCGWIETLPPPPPPRRLTTAERTDCAVIGAGFTGLAIARRLAGLRPGWRIAVLDARRAGAGSSGRSSGFVVDRAHFIARLPAEASRRYLRLCRHGIDALRSLVQAHGIACDWDESGWLHAAAGPEGAAALPNLRAWLEELGEPFEWLDAAGLERVTGTSYYRAGLRLPGSVLVQPAALARGLAASLPPGVDLFEESPVTAIDLRERGDRFRIEAGEGTVLADRLFLAANGATPALGFLRRRVFPLFTFGSLTRPLTAAEQEALGGERQWGLLAEDAMGSTVRRTRDQRILIRNSVHYTPRLTLDDDALRLDMRNLHRVAFQARFPALREVDFDFTWGGVMGASPNRGHSFGELDAGLFAAAGYTGAGIAMGTTAGMLLADLAVGEGSELLEAMLSLPEPARLPSQPFFGLGARFMVRRMNASAAETL